MTSTAERHNAWEDEIEVISVGEGANMNSPLAVLNVMKTESDERVHEVLDQAMEALGSLQDDEKLSPEELWQRLTAEVNEELVNLATAMRHRFVRALSPKVPQEGFSPINLDFAEKEW